MLFSYPWKETIKTISFSCPKCISNHRFFCSCLSCRKQTDLADRAGIIQFLRCYVAIFTKYNNKKYFYKTFWFSAPRPSDWLVPHLEPYGEGCSVGAPTQTPNLPRVLPRVPSCCSSLSPTLYFSTHNYPINAGLMPLGTRIEFGVGLGFVDQHTFPYLAHQRASEGSQY